MIVDSEVSRFVYVNILLFDHQKEDYNIIECTDRQEKYRSSPLNIIISSRWLIKEQKIIIA